MDSLPLERSTSLRSVPLRRRLASALGRAVARAEKVHIPFWRVACVLVPSLLLVFALDVYPRPIAHAWTLAWPCVLLSICAEAFYMIVVMYQNSDDVATEIDVEAVCASTSVGASAGAIVFKNLDSNSELYEEDKGHVRSDSLYDGADVYNAKHVEETPLRGLKGVIRVFDIWFAWAVCFGNCLMIFYILGSHNTHFSGLERLGANASAFEAWSYFVPFALFACAGNGLVGLQPATASMRLALGTTSMGIFFVVCLLIYSGTSEAIVRLGDRMIRDRVSAAHR